jgi:hypothetical protein
MASPHLSSNSAMTSRQPAPADQKGFQEEGGLVPLGMDQETKSRKKNIAASTIKTNLIVLIFCPYPAQIRQMYYFIIYPFQCSHSGLQSCMKIPYKISAVGIDKKSKATTPIPFSDLI